MRHLITAIVVAGLLAFPAAASAAEADATDMEVQVWAGAEPGQVLVIVSSSVPDNVKLPAVVRLPIVQGMTAGWAGEIAPEGQGDDIQRQPTTKTGSGGSYVEIRAEKYRNVQVELTGQSLVSDGSRFSTKVDYVQTVPAATTGFSVRLPSGASAAQVSPLPAGQPARNEAGELLYTLPSAELKPGEKQTISLSYALGGTGTTGAAPSGGPSTGTLVGVLLLVLAVAVVGLVIAMGRQRRSE